MNFIIFLVVLLVLLYAASHFSLPLIVWTVITAGAVILMKVFGVLGIPSLLILLALVFLPLLILNVPFLRKIIVSGPLHKMVKSTMPPISETEQVALDAGTVWWEADLFGGNPCLLYTSPSPRDATLSRMPSSA